METKYPRFELCSDPNCFGSVIGGGKRHGEIWMRKTTKSIPLFSVEAALINLEALTVAEVISEGSALLIVNGITAADLPEMYQDEDEIVQREIASIARSMFALMLLVSFADPGGLGFSVVMPEVCPNGCHRVYLRKDGQGQLAMDHVRKPEDAYGLMKRWAEEFQIPKEEADRLTNEVRKTTVVFNNQMVVPGGF